MIRTIFIRITALFALTALPATVWAIPITGEIAYGGAATLSGGNLNIINPVVLVVGTGDLAGIGPIWHSPVAIPAVGGDLTPVTPLWQALLGSFTLQSGSRTDDGTVGTSVTLVGTGIMKLFGFEDTAYNWSLSFDPIAETFAFFSAANRPVGVPEPSTLLLLGSGLLAIGFRSRRRAQQQ